jgi:two-component system response regulator FixJ
MATPQTVYVVDDDIDVRDALQHLFASVKLDCRLCGTAEEFLACYDSATTSCLVLDVRMPGLSGAELHRLLLTRGIAIPVVFISGYGDVPLAVEAMRRGAVTFLEKPVNAQELLDRVHEALEQDAQRRAREGDIEEIETRIEQLTTREREILDRLALGETTKEIAHALKLSPKTVDYHRAKLMTKMDAETLPELITGLIQIRTVRQNGNRVRASA